MPSATQYTTAASSVIILIHFQQPRREDAARKPSEIGDSRLPVADSRTLISMVITSAQHLPVFRLKLQTTEIIL